MPDHSRVHSLDLYDLLLVYFFNCCLHCSSQPSLLSISQQVIFILVLWTALLMLLLRMYTAILVSWLPLNLWFLVWISSLRQTSMPYPSCCTIYYSVYFLYRMQHKLKNYLCVYYLFSSVTYIHKYRPYMTCSLLFSQHS